LTGSLFGVPLFDGHSDYVIILTQLTPPRVAPRALDLPSVGVIEDVLLHIVLDPCIECSSLVVRRAVVRQESLPLAQSAT